MWLIFIRYWINYLQFFIVKLCLTIYLFMFELTIYVWINNMPSPYSCCVSYEEGRSLWKSSLLGMAIGWCMLQWVRAWTGLLLPPRNISEWILQRLWWRRWRKILTYASLMPTARRKEVEAFALVIQTQILNMAGVFSLDLMHKLHSGMSLTLNSKTYPWRCPQKFPLNMSNKNHPCMIMHLLLK